MAKTMTFVEPHGVFAASVLPVVLVLLIIAFP